MKWWIGTVAGLLLGGCLVATGQAQAPTCPPLSEEARAALLEEHLFGGAPSPEAVLIRRAYVSAYDPARRVPRWVAWRAAPEYLGTPPREGDWARYRTDPEVDHPVRTAEYNGLLATFDLARGHLAPYFIAGGDRDGDGLRAVDDLDDACTVYEINYLSNIAPQFQRTFNGEGGRWYELETTIREGIVRPGMPVWIIAGSGFGDAEVMTVGPQADIHVPHLYFQILITEVGVVPFLFVHTAPVGPAGCPLEAPLASCIVATADIEAVTGLDIFAELDDEFEALLETPDGGAVWQVLVGP